MLDLVIKQNINSVDDSITIYPFKDITKLEFQEKVLKLALKSTLQPNSNSECLNFLFVSSIHVDNDYNCLSLMIEQYDKGQTKLNSSGGNGSQSTPILIPSSSAQLPDAIYVPSRFVNQKNLTPEQNQLDENIDATINFYFNAVKYLTSYFLKFCNNIESLSKILSMSSTIHFNNVPNSNGTNINSNIFLNASFDLITLANCFDAQRIQPIPIIETSLLKTLQTTSNFYIKPKTGYCALYKNEHIVLVMDSEPKANKLLFMGIWISGTQSVNHPLTWAACIRYSFSNLITSKSSEFVDSFVVILFPSVSRRPEYYLCKPLHSKLEFTLFNGFNKLLVNKLSNENRCISVDLNEVKDGYRFKLFTNSVNQVFRQEIYGQNQLLQQKNQTHIQQPDKNISSILSISSQSPHESELQPRSLSSSILTTNSISTASSIQPYKTSNTINLSPRENMQVKSASNVSSSVNVGNNIIVGSYHSVSDISVLSDNDNDDSCSAYFSQANKSKNKTLSQSDEFEFLRPKEPLQILPQISSQSFGHISNCSQHIMNNLGSASTSRLSEKIKYNQNLYSSNNSLSSSLSSSYSPLPSFNNSLSAKNSQTLSANNSLNNSNGKQLKPSLPDKNSATYENSKSMLFGIPRDSPMPTIASMASADFHPINLDSPFVDITLNNCDDMSLYQPTEANNHVNTSNQLKFNSSSSNTNNNHEHSIQQYSPLGHVVNQHLKQAQLMSQNNQLISQACVPSPPASASSSYSFQNPAYLSSSMLSSSTSSSSNNSHHSSSSSSTNSCPYTYQQPIIIPQSGNSLSNTNLNNIYQNNHQINVNSTNQQQHSTKQFMANHQDTILQQQQQQCLDQYELYLKRDEQLTEKVFRIQQLQEQMNSLNLVNAQSQFQNQHQLNLNANVIATTSNAISLLSSQIEDRKNYLKQNYNHNQMNKLSQTNTSKSSQVHQNHQTLQQVQDVAHSQFNSPQIQSSNKSAQTCQNGINLQEHEPNQMLQHRLLQHHQNQQQQSFQPNNKFSLDKPHNNVHPYKEDLFSLSTNSLKSLNHMQPNNIHNTQPLSSNSLNDLSRSQVPFSYKIHQQQNFQPSYVVNESSGSSKSNSQTSLNSSHKSDNLTQKLQQVTKLSTNTNANNLLPVSTQEFQQQLRMSKDLDEMSENNNLNKLKCGENLNYLNKCNQNDQQFREKANRSDQEDDDEEEGDEDEDENNDKSECENVFGTALKDLKQNKNWQQSIIVNSSNQSTFIESVTMSAPSKNKNLLSPRGFQPQTSSDLASASVYLSDTSQLPKFNYVSLLLDEYCDKNTSINTEALAYKYLKQNTNTDSCNSQISTCNYESFNIENSCYPSSNSNTFLLETQSSSSLGVKQQQFEFYQNSFQINDSSKPSEIKSNSTPNQRLSKDNPNQRLNLNHQQNADLLPSQILSVKQKDSLNKIKINETKEASSSEESEKSEEKISSDEDGEVWLFGKPKSGPLAHNKFLDKPDTRSIENQRNKNFHPNVKKSVPLPPLPSSSQESVKQKQRKKLQIQPKRNSTGAGTDSNGKQKDFSDQDEDIDRDVTTVLDIEKLKRLPKLL